jgi:hypothetical protein
VVPRVTVVLVAVVGIATSVTVKVEENVEVSVDVVNDFKVDVTVAPAVVIVVSTGQTVV